MVSIEERLRILEEKERIRTEKSKESVYKYLCNNPKKKLIYSARNNAKTRELVFEITEEDIVIPEYCPLLGVKLTFTLGEGRIDTNASLDRIDNSKGYTKDNIQVISDLANRMKQNATKEQLVSFAENVLKIYG